MLEKSKILKHNQGMALKALKKDDIVDVVAPGFGCSLEALQLAQDYLIKNGFTPRVPENLLGDCLLHSNTDEARAEHLMKALSARDSKAIWFLRGGYGSNRLLPYLKKMKKPLKPKMTIGISDVTSLHCFFIQRWGWSGLHGSLLDRLGKGQVPAEVESELLQVIRGEKKNVEFKELEPLNAAARKKKTLKHKILGGNLTVIQGHIGTPYAVKFANRIVMLEEVGERGYRVDRMLFHLQQAKAFKDCKAVVFGSFTKGEEPEGVGSGGVVDGKTKNISTVPFALERWAESQSFPVLRGLPCGHDVIQRVLPVGTMATLKLSGEFSDLSVMTGVEK